MFSTLLATAMLATPALGHGNMITPAPRSSNGLDPVGESNKCGSKSPFSKADRPGEYCGLGCVGDACLWYQVGCYAGCPTCSLQGKDLYPTAEDLEKAGNCKPIKPTLNDKELRTYNIDAEAGSDADWTKVMPWRAPGTTGRGNPDFSPCGVSSGAVGYPLPPATGTEQGVSGTSLPPLAANKTEWKRGSMQEVEWAIYANHGGGYSYRLCKIDESGNITEAGCQENPLDFATDTTKIRYYDGSRDPFMINATTTSKGTFPEGSQWRKNPIPMCNCDIGVGCGKGKGSRETKPYPNSYLKPGQEPKICDTGIMFPSSWDDGVGTGFDYSVGVYGFGAFMFTMTDTVKVPETLESGQYVLSWRWDCEQTPQVWNSCADITVV